MLWRRSDNIVFALLLGGADLVAVGDGVECQVKGILQVLDDQEGAVTKREYAQMMVPGAPPRLLPGCGCCGPYVCCMCWCEARLPAGGRGLGKSWRKRWRMPSTAPPPGWLRFPLLQPVPTAVRPSPLLQWAMR
jgi:hypothetical protein